MCPSCFIDHFKIQASQSHPRFPYHGGWTTALARSRMSPMLITMGFGAMVLLCFRSSSSRSVSSVSSPSFVRLTLAQQFLPSWSSFLGCVEPDAVLIELVLQTATTVSTASSSAEERSLYLLKRRTPERFSSSDGKETSSTAPLRFRSHETLLPLVSPGSASVGCS